MSPLLLAAILAGDFVCPEGTVVRERTTAEAREKWCEETGGVRHGPRWAWHADGGKWFIGEYSHGQRAGEWTFWYPSGKKRSTGTYRTDRRHGRFTEWHENGTVILQGECKDGVEDGAWTRWWPNGKLELRASFRAGKLAGELRCGSRRGMPATLEQLVAEKTRGASARSKRLLARLRRDGGFEECGN